MGHPLFKTADTRDPAEPHGNFLELYSKKEWGNWAIIRSACIYELGYAHIYMDYLNSNSDTDWEPQRSRVVILSEELGSESCGNSLDAWRHFFARIIDEIENLC